MDLNWFQLSNTDHPVIPQNMYRMSGGATNNERFEQIGQSWLKHAFTALTENVCSLGCNGVGGTHLGSGCSDPYSSSLNASQSGLGSRAWVNPFTGAFPSTAASHTGHTHTGTSHRVLVAMSDLSTAANPGATYFAEGQYVTPHEYAWCQSHAGQCNMYNNVSYRQFTVTGTTSFSFSPVGATVTKKHRPSMPGQERPSTTIEPAPGVDGIGIVAYKVTNPSAGVWHYEYAVYNENLDRANSILQRASGMRSHHQQSRLPCPASGTWLGKRWDRGQRGIQQHRLDPEPNLHRCELEFGDVCAKPERERHSLGHAL